SEVAAGVTQEVGRSFRRIREGARRRGRSEQAPRRCPARGCEATQGRDRPAARDSCQLPPTASKARVRVAVPPHSDEVIFMARSYFAALALALLCCRPMSADEKPRPSVRCLAFSADGKTLAAGLAEGDKGALLLRDATKSAEKWRQPQPAAVRAVCFLPGGKALV